VEEVKLEGIKRILYGKEYISMVIMKMCGRGYD